jgi:DNA-binding transcriptional regulator YiaG
LGICQRTIHLIRTPKSLHFRNLRNYPAHPRTLGEHLRQKRIDLGLSMAQLAKQLGFGVTGSAIEKWEENQNRPTMNHRLRIVKFLGFDPAQHASQFH